MQSEYLMPWDEKFPAWIADQEYRNEIGWRRLEWLAYCLEPLSGQPEKTLFWRSHGNKPIILVGEQREWQGQLWCLCWFIRYSSVRLLPPTPALTHFRPDDPVGTRYGSFLAGEAQVAAASAFAEGIHGLLGPIDLGPEIESALWQRLTAAHARLALALRIFAPSPGS